jgi:hypothetical protein
MRLTKASSHSPLEGSAGSIEGGALDRGSAAGASSAPAAPAALSKNWVWPGHGGKHPSPLKRGKPVLKVFVLWPKKAASPAKQFGQRKDRPLAYGVVFLRLGGGLGCFSPAIDNYID